MAPVLTFMVRYITGVDKAGEVEIYLNNMAEIKDH